MKKIKIKLPFLFRRKTMLEFCEWSKSAEWRNGERKRAFIDNDWGKYIRLFLLDRKHSKIIDKNIK